MNALRLKQFSTHFSVSDALDIVAWLKPEHAYFIHMSHWILHAEVQATLPPNVTLATDGLAIEIG